MAVPPPTVVMPTVTVQARPPPAPAPVVPKAPPLPVPMPPAPMPPVPMQAPYPGYGAPGYGAPGYFPPPVPGPPPVYSAAQPPVGMPFMPPATLPCAPPPLPAPLGVSGASAQAWRVYSSQGKKYWYNTVTGETTWTEPAVLQPAGKPKAAAPRPPRQLEGGWVEYKDDKSGKLYYHHSDAGKTVWKMPPEAKPAKKEKRPAPAPAAAQASAPAAAEKEAAAPDAAAAHPQTPAEQLPPAPPSAEQPKKQDKVLEKAEEAGARLMVKASAGRAELVGQELPEEHVYGSRAERKAAFRKLLEEKCADPSLGWDQAMKLLLADDRYLAVRSKKEKEDLYREHRSRVRREREAADAVRLRQQREDFEAMLGASPEYSPGLSYSTAAAVFGGEHRWCCVEERARRRLFDEYTAAAVKRERAEAQAKRAAAMLAMRQLLVARDVGAADRYSKVMAGLHSHPAVAAVDQKDRPLVFDNIVSELRWEADVEAEARRRERRRQQRHQRDAYRALLRKKAAEDKLGIATRWKAFSYSIRDREEYADIQAQHLGHDMFDDAVAGFRAEMRPHRARYSAAMRRGPPLSGAESFDEFASAAGAEKAAPYLRWFYEVCVGRLRRRCVGGAAAAAGVAAAAAGCTDAEALADAVRAGAPDTAAAKAAKRSREETAEEKALRRALKKQKKERKKEKKEGPAEPQEGPAEPQTEAAA
eukprot:TRINITY_DN3428_c1_g1_i2.p1 TRINITY_DN3428_c1_g1~~TRINITY_DN3428_c1_g1_i2.p1  ORF type:complete len:720 (+),score=315.54 TRINITY_DN3428_c1_g1_i2:58-2160(+)